MSAGQQIDVEIIKRGYLKYKTVTSPGTVGTPASSSNQVRGHNAISSIAVCWLICWVRGLVILALLQICCVCGRESVVRALAVSHLHVFILSTSHSRNFGLFFVCASLNQKSVSFTTVKEIF